MKSAMALSLALILAGPAAALVQAPEAEDATDPQAMVDADYFSAHSTAETLLVDEAGIIQAGNASPRRDTRGYVVVSDPAIRPAGWNGSVGLAQGGPLLDPATGQSAGPGEDFPPCTASLTDRCTQTYERDRR